MSCITEIHEHKLTNREKSIKAKYGKFWCGSCDANIVSQVGKCSVCGKRENRKKRIFEG